MNFKLFISPIGTLITSINDTISFYIDNENRLKLFCLQKIKWEKKAITYEDLMRLNISKKQCIALVKELQLSYFENLWIEEINFMFEGYCD